MVISKLVKGEVLNNDQICDIFLCSPQGGMRKSNKTNTLVLISNHIESTYEDRWIDNTFFYTGMGQEGDQALYSQNKTLAESPTSNVKVHLFEVFELGKYTYQGEVYLSGNPINEIQLDRNNNPRTVFLFPLKLKDNSSPVPVTEEVIRIAKENVEKQVKKSQMWI